MYVRTYKYVLIYILTLIKLTCINNIIFIISYKSCTICYYINNLILILCFYIINEYHLCIKPEMEITEDDIYYCFINGDDCSLIK